MLKWFLPFLFLALPGYVFSSPLDDFYDSIEAGDVAKVRAFLQKNRPDLNAPAASGSCEGRTALQCASSIDVMKLLIQKGADIHARVNGSTPLESAAGNKDQGETGFFLLNKGAVPTGKALYAALWYENTELAEKLIERKADVNYRDPENGYTPLIIACEHGYSLDLIKKLMQAGARTDAVTTEGFTVLHFYPARLGAEHQSTDSPRVISDQETLQKTELLLSSGAKLEARTSEGFTPLLLAAGSNAGAAKLLISKGANIRAVSNTGETVLHMAAASGYDELTGILLDAGLNLHQKDFAGVSAIHHAAGSGNYQTIKLLVDRGANCKDFAFDRTTPLHRIALFPTAEDDYTYMENHSSDFYAGLALILEKSGPGLIHAVNTQGESPWFNLKGWMYPFPEKINLFLKHGANKAARNAEGQTLLEELEGGLQDADHLVPQAKRNYVQSIQILKR